MLLVQEYLKSGKTLEDLKLDHGLKYNIVDHKVGLNYHQLNSSETDALASQCRGLILNKDTFDIIAYPMDRFFNYGQYDHNINITDFKILEKLDGSCCIVYFDHIKNFWCLGTRNSCEGSAEVSSGYSIKEIFEQTIKIISNNNKQDLQDFMEDQNKNYTYVFELCSLLNRIVCEYKDPNIYLLACRDNISLQEINPLTINIKYSLFPKQYSFSSIEELSKIVNDFDPKDQEGVVLLRNDFYRLKLKSSMYTTYNKLHDQLDCVSMRNSIRLILAEKADDVYPMLDPYNQKKLLWLKDLIKKLTINIQEEYNKFSEIKDQKEFALAIAKHTYKTVFFKMRKGLDVFDILSTKDTFGNIIDNTVDQVIIFLKNIEPNLDKINLQKNYQ